MLNIGIIGAGHISTQHIEAYNSIDGCTVKAISDLNEDLARQRAEKYGICDVYTDYKELLNDESIDAVSIATPTFTHKDIVIDALCAGKNVLCEKPPALNAKEVQECNDMAKKTGKFLMYGLSCRFRIQNKHVKKLIDEGKMGNFVNAECTRVSRLSSSMGWLANREKGGGVLRDECIHEIDSALWFMGYPKPKTVVAAESFANSDVAERMQHDSWQTYHKIDCKRDIESVIDGYVILDNGVGMHIKAASVLNTVDETRTIELCGEKLGAKILFDENYRTVLKLIELNDTDLVEQTPPLTPVSPFTGMVNHFIDCIKNGSECICKLDEVVILMQIIDALYESAKTGKPVIFE